MTKIVDTQGKIAKAKARMPASCSVRRSPFCDEIISLRLQGHSYKKIEGWLKEQGPQHGIPVATICRNLQRGFGGDQSFLPAYEEVAEANGGDMSLDVARTLTGQVMIQRMRIDYMVRQEAEKRRTRVGYSNPRIRQEMETYLQLVEAAAKYEEEAKREGGEMSSGNAILTPEAEKALAEMILSGNISMPGVAVAKPKLTVVG